MKRFAFVMDPLEQLDLAWDTSLCLLRELAWGGHIAVLIDPPSLALEYGQTTGKGFLLHPVGHNRYRKGPKKRFHLDRFNAVFIRKDPPFDSSYLAMTYLLESLASKTVVINHPRGIRNANEKISALLDKQWAPPTLVSSDREEILAFQRKIKSDLVIKPLFDKGGKGVFLLKRTGSLTGRSCKQLQTVTRNGKEIIVAQKFIPVTKGGGDKRILIWNGKILGAFERIPKKGEFRSNLSLGGGFKRCNLTVRDKNLVRALRPYLIKEGLLFTGIDVREGFLLEVNVTSPAGLVELDQLYGGATRKMAEDLVKF